MFCGKCGAELPDDSVFCGKCGSKVSAGQAGETVESGLAVDDTVEQSGVESGEVGEVVKEGVQVDAVPQGGEMLPKDEATVAQGEASAEPVGGAPLSAQPASARPAPKRKRTGLIAGIAIAAVVACGAIGVGVWWKSDQDAKAAAEQAEWDRTHVTLVTRLGIEAPGFDDSSTAIPVRVAGTDLDGNAVDEVQYMRAGAAEVSTLPGSYELSFPGGYFEGDGTVVKAPATKLSMEVPVPAASSGDAAQGSASSASASSGVAPQSDGSQASGASEGSEAERASSSASAEPASAEPASAESASSASAEAASAGAADGSGSSAGSEAAAPVAPEGGKVSGEAPVFVEVDPLEVTDELLTEIGELAKADPQDGGKAATLQGSATEARDQAVAEEQRRKEEEERRAREEAERAAAFAKLDGWWNSIGNSGRYWYHIHDGVSDGIEVDVFSKKPTAKRVRTATIESMERATSPQLGEGYYVTFVGGSGGYFLADDHPDTLYITDSTLQFKSASDSIARSTPPDYVLNAS